MDNDSDMEELPEWEELYDEELGRSLATMAMRDNPHNKDWIPERLQRKAEKWQAGKKGEGYGSTSPGN